MNGTLLQVLVPAVLTLLGVVYTGRRSALTAKATAESESLAREQASKIAQQNLEASAVAEARRQVDVARGEMTDDLRREREDLRAEVAQLRAELVELRKHYREALERIDDLEHGKRVDTQRIDDLVAELHGLPNRAGD